MIRKILRNLLLRCLILAFTGDEAATVVDAPEMELERGAAKTAMQALDRLEAGLKATLLPVQTYEMIRGDF